MNEIIEDNGIEIKSESVIIGEIEALGRKLGIYGAWIIGVTDDPEYLKKLYTVREMLFWKAESGKQARDIQDHFVDLGMLPHSRSKDVSGDWVFVY